MHQLQLFNICSQTILPASSPFPLAGHFRLPRNMCNIIPQTYKAFSCSLSCAHTVPSVYVPFPPLSTWGTPMHLFRPSLHALPQPHCTWSVSYWPIIPVSQSAQGHLWEIGVLPPQGLTLGKLQGTVSYELDAPFSLEMIFKRYLDEWNNNTCSKYTFVLLFPKVSFPIFIRFKGEKSSQFLIISFPR